MHCKALKRPEFLRRTMLLPLLMDSTQLRAGSAGYTPPEKKQLKWLDYVSFQESKLYIGLYSHPHTPTGYPFFLPHATAHRKENCGVSLSSWIPNCNKSKRLIFLPFRTLVSEFKLSPISQVDICQLTSCISQNKTALEINHPTYDTSCPYPCLLFRSPFKSGSYRTVQMFTEELLVFIQSPQTMISERIPDSKTKQVSPIRRVPICVPFATWNAGLAQVLCTFTTEAKLSVTVFDDDDNDDDGGRRGGGETTKPHPTNIVNGIIQTLYT